MKTLSHLAFAVVALALAAPGLAVPARAQQSLYGTSGAAGAGGEAEALAARLSRIERDLAAVQRNLYGAAPGAAASDAAAMAPSEAARVSLRLDEIEQALRQMTGQVERLQFELRQVNQRLDNLAADTDFRLRDLEGTGHAQSAAAPAARPAPLQPSPSQNSPSQDGVAAGQAARMGSLGTVPAAAASAYAARDRQAGAVPQALSPQTPSPQALSGSGQGAAGGPVVAAAGPDEAYAHAMSLLRKGDYEAAEVALTAFLEAHGNSRLAGNAQYWLGETYYVRARYQDAARAFLAGYQTYASSPKAPDSLLKLGITLLALGQTQDGCLALSEVSRTFPKAPQSVKLRAEQERSRAGCV